MSTYSAIIQPNEEVTILFPLNATRGFHLIYKAKTISYSIQKIQLACGLVTSCSVSLLVPLCIDRLDYRRISKLSLAKKILSKIPGFAHLSFKVIRLNVSRTVIDEI